MPFDCPRWPPEWPEIQAALQQVVESGQWGRYAAPVCDQLRQRLIQEVGATDARICCSGTAALELALRAAKVGPGQEVILCAMDYPGNFRTIELLGAKPVLVDSADGSPCIALDQLERAASDCVRAVVVSHLFGRAAEVARAKEICDERGWILIEDACQSIGMEIGGSSVGGFGHFATFSFGGSKLVSAGNGGALVANSSRLAARLGGLIDRPGDVYPLSALQAAVIGPQLDRLAEMNEIRNETAKFLRQEVALPNWKSESDPDHGVIPAIYKLAWTAESSEHRERVITAARKEQVPIGAGFRSTSGCSERRCRKPIATPRADRLSGTLFVLDHSALLLPPERRGELAESLKRVHDA